MTFNVGDEVKVDSPGAWFNGRHGEIIAKRETHSYGTMFDIAFPDLVSDPEYRQDDIGTGFKTWELRPAR